MDDSFPFELRCPRQAETGRLVPSGHRVMGAEAAKDPRRERRRAAFATESIRKNEDTSRVRHDGHAVTALVNTGDRDHGSIDGNGER
jgi:hypothetical protein